jgi:hypothetical protein
MVMSDRYKCEESAMGDGEHIRAVLDSPHVLLLLQAVVGVDLGMYGEGLLPKKLTLTSRRIKGAFYSNNTS